MPSVFTLARCAIAAVVTSLLSPTRAGSPTTGYARIRLASNNTGLGYGSHRTQNQVSPASDGAPASTDAVLECFQVSGPVWTPHGPSVPPSGLIDQAVSGGSATGDPCTVLLMDHVFASSYGQPFVASYTPPSCAFNRVVVNFTAVSEGRQFDRLAMMFFGDTEVWRTSTAEPVRAPGIHWTYLKDMTEYLYFWKSPQTLVFDLGNLVNDKYTGSFNTTLTATFFQAEAGREVAPPADSIIPISSRKGAVNQPSHFTLPADNATNTVAFPRNANRAVFSVSANGQANEEFWWSNVLQSDVYAFNQTAGALPGLSPFREVRLLIDGKLAGVDWPFPVIFTGGVVPSLHRPIVGIQAFDLKEHEIDITPWLPVLCDGAEHTFTVQVAGIQDDGLSGAELTESVDDTWYVTGKIFIWLDEQAAITTGSLPVISTDGPNLSLSHSIAQNATGFNETLAYSTLVRRSFEVRSTISTQGQTGEVVWSQRLAYSNNGFVGDYGFTQINNMVVTGVDTAIGPGISYSSDYEYPLYCNTKTDMSQGSMTITGHLVQGLEARVQGNSVHPTGLEAFENSGTSKFAASQLSTSRDGTAWFSQTADGKNSSGFGTTNQVFVLRGSPRDSTLTTDTELYFRNVTAVNSTITEDTQRHVGVTTRSLQLHGLDSRESLGESEEVSARFQGWTDQTSGVVYDGQSTAARELTSDEKL